MSELRVYRDRYEAAATLLPADAREDARDFYGEVARRLRAARKAMGLQQHHVAEVMGVWASVISRAESAQRQLTVTKICAFGQLMVDHTFDG